MLYKVCKIDEISDLEISQVLMSLSSKQREYIMNKPHEKRRQSLTARVLLYKLFQEYYPGVDLSKFGFNERGKPIIFDNENIYLSITHSGDMVGCAISKKPIGIDIEKKRDVSIKIINRVCTPLEQKYLIENPINFFRVWTAKVAFYKASHKSFSDIIKCSFSDGVDFTYDKSYIILHTGENPEYFWTVIELIK